MAITLHQDPAQTASGRRQTTIDVTGVNVGGTDFSLLGIVSAHMKNSGDTLTSVTWDPAGANEALSEVRRDENDTETVWTAIWQLQSPTAGDNKILRFVFPDSDPTDDGGICAAISLEGVEQATAMSDGATGGFDLGTTLSISVVSESGDLVIDVAADVIDDLTIGAGQTENFTDFLQNSVRGGSSREAGAGSVTMSWTIGTTQEWCMSGVNINAAAAAAGQPTMRRWDNIPHMPTTRPQYGRTG